MKSLRVLELDEGCGYNEASVRFGSCTAVCTDLSVNSIKFISSFIYR